MLQLYLGVRSASWLAVVSSILPLKLFLSRTWCSHPACKRVHWRSRRERHKRQWRRERPGDTTLGVRRRRGCSEQETKRRRNKKKTTKKREEKNERDKRKNEDERDKCIILVNTGWTQQERRRLIKLSASHHQRSWLREAGHEADTPRCPKKQIQDRHHRAATNFNNSALALLELGMVHTTWRDGA